MKQENLAHTCTQFKPEASVKTLMQTFLFSKPVIKTFYMYRYFKVIKLTNKRRLNPLSTSKMTSYWVNSILCTYRNKVFGLVTFVKHQTSVKLLSSTPVHQLL